MKKINKEQSGIALILTMIISSIILLVTGLIANITLTQLKLSNDISDSAIAIFAADSGIEWQLYQIRREQAVPQPTMLNGATVTTVVTGAAPNFTVKSLGSYKETNRQFEISF